MPLHRVALRIALADEHAEQHARDVGVENGGALAEREAADRAGRVGADALEREQRLLVGRQLAAVARDRLARDRLQALRPDVVAERIPRRRSLRASGAAASASSDGYLSSHSAYFGSTRSTCVCCSMISETRMWYGSSVLRHGRSRPWRRYQASSRCAKPPAIGRQRASARRLAVVRARPSRRRASQASRIIRPDDPVKIYTRTGDTGETSLFDGTRVSKADAARRRVRRGRRAERLARPRARVGARSATSTTRSLHIQRDLFALGAQLADPADKHRGARDEGRRRRRRRRRGSKQLIDRLEAELPPLRRFILAGGAPAGAALHVARTVCRRAERRMVALDAAGRRRAACATSTGCPTCCSCWPAWSIIARACPRPSGERASGRVASARPSRLTASKTARASSCDTRSRIAPHSTSTVPVDRFDRDVPAIAGDAFRAIVEAGRRASAAASRCRVRDGRPRSAPR